MLNSSVGCSLIKTIDLPWIEEGEEKKKPIMSYYHQKKMLTRWIICLQLPWTMVNNQKQI